MKFRMTKNRKKEIECLDYFKRKNIDYSKCVSAGSLFDGINIRESEEGISAEQAYFEIGDNGVKNITVKDKARLLQLLDAKKWRLRFMQEYEDDNLIGAMPYWYILGFADKKPVPKSVMEFIAKTMFQGIDKELIISFYKSELKDYVSTL